MRSDLQFDSADAAWQEVARLAAEPDSIENRPPCTSWRTCGRSYRLSSWDASTVPWKKLHDEAALTIRAGKIEFIASRVPLD